VLEAEARVYIDKQLNDCGWVVQDKTQLNLFESLGVAVREMDTDTGPADYMLFIDGKACGIIEAKKEGANLGGVAEQSARYASSHNNYIERWVEEDSLEDTENLPAPDVLAQEIVEQLEVALVEFRSVEDVLANNA